MRPLQGHILDLRNRRNALGDHPLHFIDREQRAGESKAIVGELSHQAFTGAAAEADIGAACLRSLSTIASISLRSTAGTLTSLSGTSVAIATMCGSSGCSSGLLLAARWTSSFGNGSRL